MSVESAGEGERPRRLWTPIVALILVFPAVLAAGVVGALLAGVVSGVGLPDLGDPKFDTDAWTRRVLVTPGGFAVVVLSLQAVLFAGAFVAGKLSSVPFVERLGLGPGRLPLGVAAALTFGSLAFTPPMVWLLERTGLEPGPSLELILHAAAANPWLAIVLLSVAPGVCEELFFRGYVQRRLQDVLAPAAAIAIPAVTFGLVHFDPMQSPFAAVLGAWLGFLAWRHGSIRIAIAAHALNNFVSMLIALRYGADAPASVYAEPVVAAVHVLAAASLVVGLVLLRRAPRPPRPTSATKSATISTS